MAGAGINYEILQKVQMKSEQKGIEQLLSTELIPNKPRVIKAKRVINQIATYFKNKC